MKHFWYIPVCLFLFASHTSLSAQIVHADVWTGYEDGIGIYQMVQRDSFLYINTYYGTAFVNTNTKKTIYFHEMNKPGLPGGVDLSIATVDSEGKIWTIFNHQLVSIKPDGTIQYLGQEPKTYRVSVLKLDHNGQIWAGLVTGNIGLPSLPTTMFCLVKFNGSEWENVNFGKKGYTINDIAFDSQNRPVVTAVGNLSYENGIYQFDGTNFVLIPGSAGHDKIAISSDGRIATCGDWASSSALLYYRNGSLKFYGSSPSNLEPRFMYPHFDDNNTLWVAHAWGNIYKLDDAGLQVAQNEAKNYRTDGGRYTYGCSHDSKGQLWLGTSDGLFVAPDPDVKQWDFVPTADLLTPEHPSSIAAYKDTVWLANNSGITRLYKEKFEKMNWPATFEPVICYDTLRHGLWVGSEKGIVSFHQGSERLFQLDVTNLLINSFSNKVENLKIDADGNLWIHTLQTVLCYDGNGNWKAFDSGEEFPADRHITYLYVKDRSVYVKLKTTNPAATFIVYKIEGNTITDLNLPQSLLNISGRFSAISDEDIWFVGSSSILHYQGGQTTRYTESDLGGHLNNQDIMALNDSTVFVFSNYGLYVFINGTWFYPKIPSNQISNNTAFPGYFYNNKLYLSNSSLLIVEDVKKMLHQLYTGTSTTTNIDVNNLVYPNPIFDHLNLEPIKTKFGSDCRVLLFNLNGQLELEIAAPLPATRDVATLPTGVYVLAVRAKDGAILKSMKIMKL